MTTRRPCLEFAVSLVGLFSLVQAAGGVETPLAYRIELTAASRGFDGRTCWVHARAGILPAGSPDSSGSVPVVVMTLQRLLLTGSDVFCPLHTMISRNQGVTWSEPKLEPVFQRQQKGDQIEMTVCDFWPKWHAASGRLLGTGHTVWYRNNRVMPLRPRDTAYAVYDAEKGVWLPWRTLAMPDEPRFKNAGAGCTQRYDLPGGDILLPIYYHQPEEKLSRVTVVRCRFDGQTLRYVEHGDELSLEVPRGFGEPSLARFEDRFSLTLRNDQHGYVTAASDGLHFDPPRRWTFDDGSDLGNYNTQQHWVAHSDGLFLVYTRRGAGQLRRGRRQPGRDVGDRLGMDAASRGRATRQRQQRLGGQDSLEPPESRCQVTGLQIETQRCSAAERRASSISCWT